MILLVRRASTLFVLGVAAAGFACGGSTNPPNTDDGSGATSCDGLSKAASDEVSSAIAAHQACSVDADCVSVGLSASCFDHCSRVVAKEGEAAVTAAKERVNGAQCKQFLAQGCKFDIPPCSPPVGSTCKAGVCTGG